MPGPLPATSPAIGPSLDVPTWRSAAASSKQRMKSKSPRPGPRRPRPRPASPLLPSSTTPLRPSRHFVRSSITYSRSPTSTAKTSFAHLRRQRHTSTNATNAPKPSSLGPLSNTNPFRPTDKPCLTGPNRPLPTNAQSPRNWPTNSGPPMRLTSPPRQL